mmetsp:Transcript_137068/g.273377  ORF Transcript_137068/g.273377 Transcript_137068/m.273377 type:complete len:303 (+) Transcript_137068:2582-3490(+)
MTSSWPGDTPSARLLCPTARPAPSKTTALAIVLTTGMARYGDASRPSTTCDIIESQSTKNMSSLCCSVTPVIFSRASAESSKMSQLKVSWKRTKMRCSPCCRCRTVTARRSLYTSGVCAASSAFNKNESLQRNSSVVGLLNSILPTAHPAAGICFTSGMSAPEMLATAAKSMLTPFSDRLLSPRAHHVFPMGPYSAAKYGKLFCKRSSIFALLSMFCTMSLGVWFLPMDCKSWRTCSYSSKYAAIGSSKMASASVRIFRTSPKAFKVSIPRAGDVMGPIAAHNRGAKDVGSLSICLCAAASC